MADLASDYPSVIVFIQNIKHFKLENRENVNEVNCRSDLMRQGLFVIIYTVTLYTTLHPCNVAFI